MKAKKSINAELSNKTVTCSEDPFLDHSVSLKSACHLRYRNVPVRVV